MSGVTPQTTPHLRPGVRVKYDEVRQTHVVLYPEGVLLTNETTAAILGRCDGTRPVSRILSELAAEYDDVQLADVTELLASLETRRLIDWDKGR